MRSIFCVLFWILPVISGSGIQTELYSKRDLCDVQDRLDNNCMQHVSVNETMTKCCVRCSKAKECIGASVDKINKLCYLHDHCNATSGCQVVEKDFLYLEKNSASLDSLTTTTIQPLPCVSGTWNTTSAKCDCTFSMVGQLCERYPHNCSEVAENYPDRTFYFSLPIQPPGYSKFFTVFCLFKTSETRTIFFRNAGELNFNRSWTSYVDGFLDSRRWNSSFWMGLEKMRYFLGPEGKDIRLDYSIYYQNRFQDVFLSYSKFVIGDVSSNYSMSYSSYALGGDFTNVTSADCLASSNMTSFSTYDADHDDENDENCAVDALAGWWFSRCNITCNLLGMYPEKIPGPPTEKGYILLPGMDKQIVKDSLKSVEMHFTVYR